MTEAEPDARAALAAVNVELLDVIPAGELTTRYPSALTRSRRAVQSKEGSQVAILRCSRAGIFSSLMDCGETWAVGVVQDRLAIIGKRPSRPDPRFRSAAWLCPKGENFATTLWRPCNGRHFRTGLGDRATVALGGLLVAPGGAARPLAAGVRTCRSWSGCCRSIRTGPTGCRLRPLLQLKLGALRGPLGV